MSRDVALTTLVFLPSAAIGSGVVLWRGPDAAPYVLVVLASAVLAITAAMGQRIRSEIESRYRRTEALLSVYATTDPKKPLPIPNAYMASPELLRAVTLAIYEVRPSVMLELGSGVSTVLSAYALSKNGGGGRLIALDHEAKYAEQTNAMLRMHGLDHIAKALHAPLVDIEAGGRRGKWYDLSVLPRADVPAIDLLVVDGPPGKDQPLARYPALPMLRERLSARACVVVDDARRPDETLMVKRWASEFPEFDVDVVPTEKGTTFLRRRVSAKAAS